MKRIRNGFTLVLTLLLMLMMVTPAQAISPPSGPVTVSTGETVVLRIYGGNVDGVTADITTTGMEFLSCSSDRSNESSICLIADYDDEMTVTYTYKVTAQPGETVSYTLSNAVESYNGVDTPVAGAGWQANVVSESGNGDFPLLSGAPFTITSTKPYKIKGICAAGQDGGMTVQQVLSSFEVREDDEPQVQIIDRNGAVKSSMDLVCTGDVLELFDSNNTVCNKATIIVSGDVLGNGQMQLSQMAALTKAYKDNSLTDCYLEAGDWDGSGSIIGLSDLVAQAKQYLTDAVKPIETMESSISVIGPEVCMIGSQICLRMQGYGDASAARIVTQDLEIVSFSGGLSDKSSLLLLENYGGMKATYICRVTGRNPSLQLTNAVVAMDDVDYSVPDNVWSGRVPSDDRAISISGPLDVRKGETVTLGISAPGEGVTADIATCGLELISYSGGLSDETSILLLSGYGGMRAVYVYRVTASPGETVSMNLSNVIGSENMVDTTWPQSSWSAVVSGIAPEPLPAIPSDGLITIGGPSSVRYGDTVRIGVAVHDVEGLTADIATEGLELLSFSGGLSDETSVLLLADYGGMSATYTYRVTAKPGGSAGFYLSNCIVSKNMVDTRVSSTSWQCNVSSVGSWSWDDPSESYLRISGPASVKNGGNCDITVISSEAGTTAPIHTTGLKFLGITQGERGLSSESGLVLLRNYGGNEVTYHYIVTASAGERVGFALESPTVSDGTLDYPCPSKAWSTYVYSTQQVNPVKCKMSIIGPSAAQVQQASQITLQVIPENGTGLRGNISTSGLRFISATNSAVNNSANVFLAPGEIATYVYEVTAAPGQTVSFGVLNGTYSDTNQKYTYENAQWSGTVQASPNIQTPAAASSYISITGPTASVRKGDVIDINFSARYLAGFTADLRTEGLDLIAINDQADLSADLSKEDRILLLDSYGLAVTYRYRVKDTAQERVAVYLANCVGSRNGRDFPIESTSWTESVLQDNDSASNIGTDVSNGLGGSQQPPSGYPQPQPTATLQPQYPVISPSLPSQNPTVSSSGQVPTLADNHTASVFVEDNRLKGLPIKSKTNVHRHTAADIRELYHLPSEYEVQVRSGRGEPLSDSDYIGTGCTVHLLDSAQKSIDYLVVIINGDALGSGEINVSQIVAVAQAMKGKTELDYAYQEAVDWDGDGTTNLSDLVREAEIFRRGE